MIQLTGFSDPVYAEAYINVNQYDIVLDVLVVNQTPDTLQGLSLELATLGELCTVSRLCPMAEFTTSSLSGDLKLVEKPSPCTVGPHDFVNIKVGAVPCRDCHMIA